MTRWDLVYKWADPETQSIVDAVTSALENCDRKFTEALAAPRAEGPQALVDEQAEDEGLWFDATTASEAYLQQELRRLHAAIEGAAPRSEGLGWPDPKALATALYRDYDYTVTPDDIRAAYARLSRPSDEPEESDD